MILAIFTLFHVLISIVAIVAGVVVVAGMLTAKRRDRWTRVFLATTVATSVTGFLFPVHHFMPSHAVGVISLLVLSIAIFSRYRRHLARLWRPTYVVTATLSLYLNVFVLIVQLFMKVPALKSLAPTQSELQGDAIVGSWALLCHHRFRTDQVSQGSARRCSDACVPVIEAILDAMQSSSDAMIVDPAGSLLRYRRRVKSRGLRNSKRCRHW